MKEIQIRTSEKRGFVDVTDEIGHACDRDGVWMAFVPHTTAGITINEGADPAVGSDILTSLEGLVPEDADYEHTEGNAPAHVMASLIGSSVLVAVDGGRLRLGRWQSVFFCEFDGPRTRRLWLWPL